MRLRSYQNSKATNPVKVSMMQVFWQFCGQYNVSWNDKGSDKYLSWKSFHISGFTLTAFTFCTFDADVCLCINTLSCILRIRRFLISLGDGHVFQLPLFGFDYLLGRTTDFWLWVSRSPTQLFSPVIIPGPQTAKPLLVTGGHWWSLMIIVSSPSTIKASPTPAASSCLTHRTRPGVPPKRALAGGKGMWGSGDAVMPPLATWTVAAYNFLLF